MLTIYNNTYVQFIMQHIQFCNTHVNVRFIFNNSSRITRSKAVIKTVLKLRLIKMQF